MKKILFVLLLLPLGIIAQTKTTQKTQIVVALHTEKNQVDALYTLASIKKDQKLLQSCDRCKHFLGELSGTYEEQGMVLIPKAGATIIVFKEQEVFAEKKQFPANGFKTKDEIILGKTKAIIIENKKGELILKTNDDEN